MDTSTWKKFFDVLAFVVVFVVPVILYLMEKAGASLTWIFVVGWASIAVAALYLALSIPWVWADVPLPLRVWRFSFVCSIALLTVGYGATKIWPTRRESSPKEAPSKEEADKTVKAGPQAKLVVSEVRFLKPQKSGLPVNVFVKNVGTHPAFGLKHSEAVRVSAQVIGEEFSKKTFDALRAAASNDVGPVTDEIQPQQTIFYTVPVEEITSRKDLKELSDGKKLIYLSVILRYGDMTGKWESGFCAYYGKNPAVANLCSDNNYSGKPIN